MSQNSNINSNQPNEQEAFYGQPVFVYTSDQAVEDGILFDVTTVNPAWKKGLFNYVTVNLLHKGYLNQEDKINILNLLDLLNHSYINSYKLMQSRCSLDLFSVQVCIKGSVNCSRSLQCIAYHSNRRY